MKILIVSHISPWPPNSGGPVQVYKLVKYLLSELDVHLLCPINGENKRNLEKDTGISVHSFSRITLLSMLTKRILRRLKFPDIFSWLYNPLVYRDVKRVANEINPDLIHSVYLASSPHALKVAEKYRLPFVLTEPDIEYLREKRRKELLGEGYSDFALRTLKEAERKICDNSDMVVVLSDFDKKVLRDIGVASDIKVIFNGIDYESYQVSQETRDEMRKRLNIKENDIVLFYHGIFSDKANRNALFSLVDIYKSLRDEGVPVRLAVMGTDLDRTKIPEDVIAISEVQSHEVPRYLSIADIAAVPLRYGTGVRLKIVEYLTMGLPTISTLIGAEGIPLKDKEDIILVDDVGEEFVKGLENLIENKALQLELKKNGRALAKERLDWNILIKNYEEIYRLLIRET